jgi:hypothetical protein
MRAVVTTTARKLVAAYGESRSHIQGIWYTSFGRSGLLTPELTMLCGIERCADFYWIVESARGRRRIGPDEPIQVID